MISFIFFILWINIKILAILLLIKKIFFQRCIGILVIIPEMAQLDSIGAHL